MQSSKQPDSTRSQEERWHCSHNQAQDLVKSSQKLCTHEGQILNACTRQALFGVWEQAQLVINSKRQRAYKDKECGKLNGHYSRVERTVDLRSIVFS